MEASPQPPMPEMPAEEVALPPIRKQTIITNVHYFVHNMPTGPNGGEPGKLLQFIDATGESYQIPIGDTAARKIAAMLDGRQIEVASHMPPPPPRPPA